MRKFRIFIYAYTFHVGDIYQYTPIAKAYSKGEMETARHTPMHLMNMLPKHPVLTATPFNSFNEAMAFLEISTFLPHRACVGIMKRLKNGQGYKVMYVRPRGLSLHMSEIFRKMGLGGVYESFMGSINAPSKSVRTSRLNMGSIEYSDRPSVKQFVDKWCKNIEGASKDATMPTFEEWSTGLFWDNMFARARFQRDVADKLGVPLDEILKRRITITVDQGTPIPANVIHDYTIEFAHIDQTPTEVSSHGQG